MAGSVAGTYSFTAELRRSSGFVGPVEASVPVSQFVPTNSAHPFGLVHIDFPNTVDVTGDETFTLRFSDITGQGILYIEQTGFDNLPCPDVEETNENNVANPTERSEPAGFKVLALTVGQCGIGLPISEHKVASAALTPTSGPPGSEFEVSLRDVDQNDFTNEPAEARWDDGGGAGAQPQGLTLGSLIGQAIILKGQTSVIFDAQVPEKASVGQHEVTVCWRYNSQETWYYTQVPFDVTPEVTPTPTPAPTPTPTPTPAPLYAIPFLPIFELIPLPAPSSDLSIHGIEITQAIQCFDTSNGLAGCPDNSLPVVTRKNTTARIYPRYSGDLAQMSGVPVRLHILAFGNEYISNTYGTAKPNIDQANNDNANVWFRVDTNSNSANVQFWAEVDPNNVVAETNESNNRFPASGTISMNFQKRDTVDITSWRTRYHPSGYTGTQYAQGWAVNGGAADWLEYIWPVRSGSGIDHTVKSGYLDWTTAVSGGTSNQNSNGQHALIQKLNLEWVLHNILPWLFGTNELTGAEHVYGWVDNQGYTGGHADMPVYPHAGGLGVVGIGTDNFSPPSGTVSVDNPSSGATIFGHELTHDYDLKHTDTGADDCGSNDNTSTFPYANSSIQEFGYNPDTGKVYDPSTTHDLMSYCPPNSKQGWISPFTWNQMFGAFNPSDAGNRVAGSNTEYGKVIATTAESSLAGSVFVDNPDIDGDDGAELQGLHKVDGVGLEVSPPAGDYAVELRDGEQVLATKSIPVNFVSEYAEHNGTGGSQGEEEVFSPEPAPFVSVPFIMSWVPGATSVALVHGNETLDEVPVSANAPVVNITSPAGPEAWAEGSTHTLEWEGSDADGDDLTYTVLYSNGGDNWELIESGITDTSFDVEVDYYAGGDAAQFGVVATDGINVGTGESPAIDIPNKAPLVAITDPAPGAVITPGGLVVLSGAATDLEDGALQDDAFEWSSDVDGDLGTGPSLPLNTLSEGLHTISLRVEDSEGEATTNMIVILVAVPASVDFDPDIVSPNGPVPEVTVIVELPFGYPTDDLDLGSLQMIIDGNVITPTDAELIGDEDMDQLNELMLTFDGEDVQDALPGGVQPATVTVTGELENGTGIQGSDTVGQVGNGDVDCDGDADAVDALNLLKSNAQLPANNDCIAAAGDIDCDGDTDSVDALGILRFNAGLDVNQQPGCPPLVEARVTGAVLRQAPANDDGGSAFPSLPPTIWLSVAFVLPALVLTGRRFR